MLLHKILFFLSSVFLISSTIAFSWLPVVVMIPILSIFMLLKILTSKVYLIRYLIIFLLSALSLYTLDQQIIHIEWVRNILISMLFPVVYFMFSGLKYESSYKMLRYIHYSCLFVIFYVILINAPQNFD